MTSDYACVDTLFCTPNFKSHKLKKLQNAKTKKKEKQENPNIDRKLEKTKDTTN